MEGEQERRGKTKRKKGDGESSTKDKHWRDKQTTVTIVPNLAQEAEVLVVGTNKAYTNEGSRENEYNCGEPKLMDKIGAEAWFICHGGRSWKELL